MTEQYPGPNDEQNPGNNGGTEPTPPMPPPPPPGSYGPPPSGQLPPPPGQYGAPPSGQYPAYGAPHAGYGFDPKTGLPFSDKSKLIAGLLQILLPLGIGRMYMGQTGLGIAQLVVTLVTCGAGALWPFIDGILILVGDPKDEKGLPLRS